MYLSQKIDTCLTIITGYGSPGTIEIIYMDHTSYTHWALRIGKVVIFRTAY